MGVVLVFAKFSYGSKLSLSIGGFTFQPSEFVKIIFVFAVASLLAKATDFKHVVITTAIAGAHVLILVVSKDLGSALIFFVTYLVMLYVGTRDWRYLFLGIAAGVIASVAAYFLSAMCASVFRSGRILLLLTPETATRWPSPFSLSVRAAGLERAFTRVLRR